MGDTADDLANISIIRQLQEQNDNLKKLIEQQAKLIRMQKVANLKNRDPKTLTEIDRTFIENEESANNELTEEDRAELVTAFKNRELMEKLSKERNPEKKPVAETETYFLNWNEMPGRESEKLLYFMKALFGRGCGLDWISTDKIDKIYKINNDKTIVVTAGKNFFLLSLNDEKNRVNLISDGMIIKQFIAKTENGKLYMYVLEKIYGKIIEMGQKHNILTPEEENEKIAKQLIAFKEKQKKMQEKNEKALEERQRKLALAIIEEQNKKKKKNQTKKPKL